ncbi:MAG: dihydropyrimidinase [Chloroflexi bacterium]|nr:dihydropyrimidinase [Chloroflexota bacterium]
MLIRNATVVTAGDVVPADVLVRDGTVAEIGRALPSEGRQVIDGTGKLLMPGGIDVHTHLDMPLGDTASTDDFETGHIAAACGGTTTHIDFATQEKGRTLAQALENWHLRAQGKACIDYGFHIAVTDWNDAVAASLPELIQEGVTSLKLYMAYKGRLMVDDAAILRALQIAAKVGLLVMIHAENGDIIDLLTAQLLAAGHTAPRYHAQSRPAIAEAEATYRAIALAEIAGAPLYIVHLTSAQALDAVRRARHRGLPVYAETCPQYLAFTADDLARPGFEGAKFVCSPPLRTAADQKALWRGLALGDLQVVATDHCPWNFHGHKDRGKSDFSHILNGLPGIEERMKIVYTYGVETGRLDLQQFVALTATTPAKLFGLYPRKGSIAPGSDADLVLWDPEARGEISVRTHHSRVDHTPYEGIRYQGRPDRVWVRGRLVVEGGEWVGTKGQGKFLKRDAFHHVDWQGVKL